MSRTHLRAASDIILGFNIILIVRIVILVVLVAGFVDGQIGVVAPDELAPEAVFVTFLEFPGGFVDGFEEGGSDASEGGGTLGVEAAFGDGAHRAGKGVGERGSGDEIVAERFADFGGSVVGFAKMAELAFVVETKLRSARRALHAALAAIGIGEGTGRRVVIRRHKILQFKSDL